MHLLEALFIVHFNLAEKKELGPSSGPLCIGASITMLPYGWLDLDAYLTVPPKPLPIAVSPSGVDSFGRRRKAGVELFLQITGVGYVRDPLVPQYDRAHRMSWENVRAEFPNPSPDCEVLFVGLLLLDDGANHDHDNFCPLPIRKIDIEAFRNGTFFSSHSQVESALGERVPRPLTSTVLIRFVLLFSPWKDL